MEYLDFVQTTSRKYVMVLPTKWTANYDDYVFARVIVDRLLESGKIQINLARSDEKMQKIYQGMQTYILWGLNHPTNDLTSIFYLVDHLKPQDLAKMDQVVAVYMKRGSKFVSNFACKALEDNRAKVPNASPKQIGSYCRYSRSVGIQIFYQPSNATKADERKMSANDRDLYNLSKKYKTPVKLPLVSPLGQVYVHKEVLDEVLH